MSIVSKIREKGIKYCIKIGRKCLKEKINILFFNIFKLFPLTDRRIILESEGDLCDNAYALYDYLKENGYLKKYKIIWLVSDVTKYKKFKTPDTNYISKNWGKIRILTSYYLATSKFYIYDHNNLFQELRKRNGQIILYLSHGAGYKATKGNAVELMKTPFDFMTATGNISGKIMSEFWHSDENKLRYLGYSRNDYFFSNTDEIKSTLNKKYRILNYKKIILWMPTFRKSKSKELSEDYLDAGTGLPLLESECKIYEFNEFLRAEKLLLVLKVHPLQAELPVFEKEFSNILILHNEDLSDLGIQLYQFVATTDALITDYSSISVDYMLLNRPIIYTLDDYREYEKSRGIIPENAIELMKGYHVYNISELRDALLDIAQEKDIYAAERKEIINQFHSFVDGNSSKRIVEFLNL